VGEAHRARSRRRDARGERAMVLVRHLLGGVLRRRRLRQGLTLREVSLDARVSLGYISEVERGQKEASSELLAAICAALEVPLSDVLREVSDEIDKLEAAAGRIPTPAELEAALADGTPATADGTATTEGYAEPAATAAGTSPVTPTVRPNSRVAPKGKVPTKRIDPPRPSQPALGAASVGKPQLDQQRLDKARMKKPGTRCVRAGSAAQRHEIEKTRVERALPVADTPDSGERPLEASNSDKVVVGV